MQSLYMEFVSARDRKVFGEYYTPDWLAALIVGEALDETWRARAIEQAETSARTSTRLDGVGARLRANLLRMLSATVPNAPGGDR